MLQRSSDGVHAVAHGYPDATSFLSAPRPQFNPIDVQEIARILRRHLRLIVGMIALLVAMALLFVTMVTPLYTATSTILIDPRRTSVLDSGGQARNFATDDASIESQVSLIQSVAVLQRVVDNLNLTQDPEFAPPPGVLDSVRALFRRSAPAGTNAEDVARARATGILQNKARIVRQRATFLVDISASSLDRAKAATIANAVADAYFVEQVRSKSDATKTAADWLNSQIAGLQQRVIASDRAVQDFRSANNLIVTQGVTINDQQVGDLNTKLIQARADAAEARAKYEQVERIANSRGDSGSVTEALGSETIARLRGQYAELAKNEADLSTKFGPRHPLLETARAQLRQAGSLIKEEIQRILQGRQNVYEVAAAREASLQASLDGLQNVSTESGQAQVRLRELQRQAEANRTLYESFLARYKEASAQESLELPESRVVAKAEPPVLPSFPKIPLTLGLALVIGLGAGCLGALAVDYLDRRIKTQEQARNASGLPSIAAVPSVSVRELAHLAKRGRAELQRYDPKSARLLPPALQPPLMRYAVEQPTSAFAEAIRSIRFALQQAARTRTTQVIMVTSAVDGEGKTTVAANLALSLAFLGIKTALVDGDMRNPELTRSLCPRVRTGLLDVALAELPLDQAILTDPASNLAVLPSPLPQDIALVTEFVSSEGMSSVLAELRNHFDVVIVDCPPVLPLIDGRVLAEQADSIVFAIGWDLTPRDVVMRAAELLGPAYERTLGTVMTRVDLGRLRFYEPYGDSTYGSPYVPGGPPAREAAE